MQTTASGSSSRQHSPPPNMRLSTLPTFNPAFGAAPFSPSFEIPHFLQAGGSPSVPSTPISPTGPAVVHVARIPQITALEAACPHLNQPHVAPEAKLSWCRDLVYILGRHTSIEPDAGPAHGVEASIMNLLHAVVPLLDQLKAMHPEAQFIRATLAAAGVVPRLIPHNRPQAFRDFEASAKAGYHLAWFNLGREYEVFGDVDHAIDCFNRGVSLNVSSCLYRMGIAHLLGQLHIPQDIPTGLALLQQAANLATLDTPQPPYTFALILLGEFDLATIPYEFVEAILPPNTTSVLEAKPYLERSAYLHYPPAQFKLGSVHEFAQYPWSYDPLLSVEWYRLAGTRDADMALSKWYLCGAEGAFEKDERLARVFAEKAASKGLVSGEFALGYYCEVGVGGNQDLDKALEWYREAANHGSVEASARLEALNFPTPAVLSRTEHDALTDERLVRKRTHARMKSEARSNTLPQAASPHHVVSEPERQHTISEGVVYPTVAVEPANDWTINSGPPTPPETPPHMLLAPQMPERKRFSLVDPGFAPESADAPPRVTRTPSGPSFRPPGKRSSQPRSDSTAPDSPISYERSGNAPSTFAEMGIEAGTLRETKSDCVVM